ncbi:MAG: Gfo/Idh/MocA family oxidoreductase [Armatimonadetes bacterium]|nr:Gfo/Idh/MocA family oxidoreductase [Armatimonadota bacterium]
MLELRIGILGAGNMFDTHLRALSATPHARVVAIGCGTRAAKKADAHDLIWVESARAMADRNDIDAVVVTTPHALHAVHAIPCLRSGKHVLVEKPMDVSTAACDRMIDAAREAGVNLMVAHSHRYWPAGRLAKSLIQDGAIGELTMVRDTLVTAGSLQGGAGWHTDPSLTGRGLLIGYGCHVVDRLRWWFGSECESVFANHFRFRTDAGLETAGMMQLRFVSGAIAHFWWNQCTPPPGFGDMVCSAEIVGTEGIIDCHTYSRLRIARQPAGEWELVYDQTQFPDARDRTFQAQAQEFVTSILDGRPPEITGTDGRAAVEIIEAAYQSSDTGTSVRIR